MRLFFPPQVRLNLLTVSTELFSESQYNCWPSISRGRNCDRPHINWNQSNKLCQRVRICPAILRELTRQKQSIPCLHWVCKKTNAPVSHMADACFGSVLAQSVQLQRLCGKNTSSFTLWQQKHWHYSVLKRCRVILKVNELLNSVYNINFMFL